ncbi:MAG: SRPBCC family protein [Bacteroidota bacterium]
MASHTIRTVQRIPASPEQVWNFFSDHANLQAITPEHMKFRVLSQHHGAAIYAGQIIEYTLKPVLGIPVYWMTEITHVVQQQFFVDEQRYGPYRMWHHQHHFKAIEGGTEMTDIVNYKNPLWVLGKLANAIFVREQLKGIFKYRFTRIEEIFGKWPAGQELQVQIN